MELTKEHFDESLKTLSDKFVTKEHFDGTINKLTTKITDIELSITGIELNITGIESNITGIETRVSGIETRVTGIESKVSGIESKVGGIEGKVSGIEGKVSSIELNIIGIKAAVNKMATQESVDDLRDRIIPIEQTLSRHTTLLDKIVYGEKKEEDEELSNSYRINRAEKHIGQLADQAKLKLEY